MCTYSVVTDDFFHRYPSIPRYTFTPFTDPLPYNGPTKEQFEELLELLRAAKKYDTKTGQPDCEMQEKKKILEALAKHLNIASDIP